MGNAPQKSPELEERFTEPEGWRWHHFSRVEGRKIRFGSVFPKDSIPDAVILCLPGLSEFGEKYYEVARTCLDMNLAFWTMDWMGQGRSARYLTDPHKRHSDGFENDVADLHYFFLEYVKHSCVHPDVGRIPVAMLAHSMGATIGLQFLHKYPDIFECAALSAPMFGIRDTSTIPEPLLKPAASLLGILRGSAYVKGGGPWDPAVKAFESDTALSNDPVRAKVQEKWFEATPELQVGSPTYGWLQNALKACSEVTSPAFLKDVSTPCLIGLAEDDRVVDNVKIRNVAAQLEHSKLLELPHARHEIFMEKDEVRDTFFKAFYALVKERIIDRPETLKPF